MTTLRKTYYVQHNIGRAKYVVNFFDGIKTHTDGSSFYNIAIFANQKSLNKFVKKLLSLDFKPQ